ncbi:MAG: hypothetical protein K2X03_17165 [Bryobacteraceae bacterium]|nr:hypothetical protein [Bryobacteraceae bacterium]
MRPLSLLIIALPLAAQILVEAKSEAGHVLPGRFTSVWEDRKAPPLRCRVDHVPPRLSFSFKYWSGFEVTLPSQEVAGEAGNRLVTSFRVRPRGASGDWTYFFQESVLPEVPADKKVDLWYGGGFFVGVGKYEVDWLLVERDGKVCRKSWTFGVNQPGKVEMATPPNTVTSVRLEDWSGFKPATDAKGEVTVMLNAAPVARRRYVTKLSPWDRTILLTSLKSVLDQVHVSRARVVVFDVDGRRELFRSADFRPRDYRRLFGVLERADFGTIDYNTLATGPPAGEFLFRVVEKEIAAAKGQPVIFLGPEMRPSNARLPERQAEVKLDAGKMFYLCFPLTLADPEDLIAKIVKGKGKSFRLFYPQDLASAIRQVNQRLAEP